MRFVIACGLSQVLNLKPYHGLAKHSGPQGNNWKNPDGIHNLYIGSVPPEETFIYELG